MTEFAIYLSNQGAIEVESFNKDTMNEQFVQAKTLYGATVLINRDYIVRIEELI